jgi:1-acyl-sn-glycerol-3-phosphate acyltransferase
MENQNASASAPAVDDSQNPYRIGLARRALMSFCRFISWPFVDFFFRVLNRSRAIGTENLPREGGALIAANHISWIDTLIIPVFSAKRLSIDPYLAPGKEELFSIPVVSTIISLWGSFPVRRGKRDFEAMKRISHYAKHYRVMIFPEGTRSKTGQLLPGRTGVGWIIYHARPVVIPTLVINTELYFKPGGRRPWFFVPYRVVFGKPLDLSRFYAMEDAKETSQAIADEIMKALALLREAHKGEYV